MQAIELRVERMRLDLQSIDLLANVHFKVLIAFQKSSHGNNKC